MTMMFDAMGNPIGDDGNDPTADTGPNPLQMDYYRNKVAEFQRTLVLLDETGSALYSVMDVVMQDDTAYNEWFDLLTQFNTKRDQFKVAAEAINLASNGMNAIGVNFPKLSIPAGLGNPAVVALAAAVAVTAALVYWASQFWQTVSAALKRWQTLDVIKQLPPEDQAAALKTLTDAETRVEIARTESASGTLGALGGLIKWVVIGGVCYLGYRLIEGEQNAKKRVR
jgi:hypothetical protein